MDNEIKNGWTYSELDCMCRFEHVSRISDRAFNSIRNDTLYAVEALISYTKIAHHKNTYYVLGLFRACEVVKEMEYEGNGEQPLKIRPATNEEIEAHQAAGKKLMELNVIAISDEELKQ